jgi:hypothetical protein
MSSFFDSFNYLSDNKEAYKSKIYLPKKEPATPIKAKTFKLKKI